MIMKKIKIVLLLGASFFISSCSDYLDVQPANVKGIGNMEDIKGMLSGYLKTVSNPELHRSPASGAYQYEWYSGVEFFPNGSVARLFYYSENSLDYTTYLNYNAGQRVSEDFLKGMNWNWTEIHEVIWNKSYKSIGFMNRVLSEVAALNEETSELQQQIVGEAKAIRSWHAFKLLQYFTPYNNNELGIPLSFGSDDLISLVSSRKTQTEVYAMIIDELKEVLAYTAPTNDNYNIFYRKNVINGILAQLYLYKATGPANADDDWANARTHAIAAMEGKYLASSSVELKTLFKSDVEKTYFDNPYVLIAFFWDNKARNAYPPMALQWGNPKNRDLGYNPFYYTGFSLHPELLALYAEGDIRMEEGMYVYNHEFYENGKWLDLYQGGGVGAMEAYSMFRVAEMHLIVAESYVREGNDATARQWLDEFKATRNATAYSSTDLLTEILNERRKEFMTEYDYTWLDLKRNGLSLTHTFTDPDAGETTVTLENNDYRYAFFIPIGSELSVNPKMEQNPGWEN